MADSGLEPDHFGAARGVEAQEFLRDRRDRVAPAEHVEHVDAGRKLGERGQCRGPERFLHHRIHAHDLEAAVGQHRGDGIGRSVGVAVVLDAEHGDAVHAAHDRVDGVVVAHDAPGAHGVAVPGAGSVSTSRPRDNSPASFTTNCERGSAASAPAASASSRTRCSTCE